MTSTASVRTTGASTGIGAVYADRSARRDMISYWSPATTPERNRRSMLKIEKKSDGHTMNLRLSRRIQSIHIGNIRGQMDDYSVRIVLDLSEVTLVDV